MDWRGVIEREVYKPLEAEFHDRPSNLAEILLQAKAAFETRTAILYEGDEITYESFVESVATAAYALRYEFGIQAGDRVVILLGTEPAFGVAVWAAATIGAVVCPMNIRYQLPELRYQLRHAEPKAIITDAVLLDRILPLRNELPSVEHIFATSHHPTDGVLPFAALINGPKPAEPPFRFVDETAPAFIFYTSGTTGRPKGVINSQRALIYSILRSRMRDPRGASPEVLCVPIPLHYTGGCKSFLGAIARGSKCILLKHWKIEDLLKTVQDHRVTNLFALGSIWALAIASPELDQYDLSSIRSVFFGGSATAPSIIDRVSKALPHARVMQGYGMTECNGGTVEEDAIARPTSSGLPGPTTQLRIVDEGDADLPANVLGQVLIRNAQIFSGYWKDPQTTDYVMRGGWYHSGDMGYLDAAGRLHLAGRANEMIIRGQENIYPAEIEAVILQHPAVQEAVVLGVPDEIFGEQVKAIVVPQDGRRIDPAEVTRHCRAHLAEFKIPKFIELRDGPLPRNPGGKVIKRNLL